MWCMFISRLNVFLFYLSINLLVFDLLGRFTSSWSDLDPWDFSKILILPFVLGPEFELRYLEFRKRLFETIAAV
jgi:hypothetical protein